MTMLRRLAAMLLTAAVLAISAAALAENGTASGTGDAVTAAPSGTADGSEPEIAPMKPVTEGSVHKRSTNQLPPLVTRAAPAQAYARDDGYPAQKPEWDQPRRDIAAPSGGDGTLTVLMMVLASVALAVGAAALAVACVALRAAKRA